MISASLLSGLGFLLVLVGIILVFAAILLLLFSSSGDRTETRGGGALIIGPIPIVFGTDKPVKTILVLSIVLMAITVIVNILLGLQ